MQWLIIYETWYMLIMVGTGITHVVCCHRMCILNSSFAYLLWLAKNKKGKNPEFHVGYSDETWYVSSARDNYPRGLLSPNVHIKKFICIFVLIGYKQRETSRVLYKGTIMKFGVWVVLYSSITYYICVLLLLIHIWSTSFAYSLQAAHTLCIFYE